MNFGYLPDNRKICRILVLTCTRVFFTCKFISLWRRKAQNTMSMAPKKLRIRELRVVICFSFFTSEPTNVTRFTKLFLESGYNSPLGAYSTKLSTFHFALCKLGIINYLIQTLVFDAVTCNRLNIFFTKYYSFLLRFLSFPMNILQCKDYQKVQSTKSKVAKFCLQNRRQVSIPSQFSQKSQKQFPVELLRI